MPSSTEPYPSFQVFEVHDLYEAEMGQQVLACSRSENFKIRDFNCCLGS